MERVGYDKCRDATKKHRLEELAKLRWKVIEARENLKIAMHLDGSESKPFLKLACDILTEPLVP